MKKEWWILIIIILFPMGLIIGIGTFNYLTETRTRKQIYLDNVKKLAFHNSINNIYKEKRDHNVLIIKGKRNDEKYKIYSNWEHKFLIGDSVSKDSGSLKLEHYRDGKLLEVLDYNDIYIREGW
ncbi:hypothetical protein F0358_12860 [Empedobacter brevis]|uniref:Uncharacterized protein n=1 Tax=Empedobacter brevis NBRC 14943 = ATCC 43319 TaxID=1218108 RepID=A0A511NLM5_9FLAO|nr:hypothetical protein [Empedobacter brevis]QES93547.1 hypothetical protein F0358_12860 [Empedobacter brevis]GEM53702.1 hypothetical protein EB1_34920 [Empedobacter brevis NBRC 14943 = ATCC 43319]